MNPYKIGRIVRLALFLLVFVAVAPAAELQLNKTGERYDLIARDVPLSEVLQRIDAMEEAALRFFGEQEGSVTAIYRGVTLDELLYRLRVSYMLVYQQDESGVYRLGDAVMLRSETPALSDAKRAHVMKLIRDLSHDDVHNNAHAASHKLQRLGCEIVPLLEDALYVNDYQGRHLAAQVMRGLNCPDNVPSDKLLEVTLQLLGRDQYDPQVYWSLFGPTDAFEYLHRREDVYARVRESLVRNLNSADPQERFLSAALLGERGETEFAPSLVRIMAPHLADNDIPTDGGVAAHALHKLGPAVLPYLSPYRRSSDKQQAELANLICTALETGEISQFQPVMYAGYPLNPLQERTHPRAIYWRLERFPDSTGRYHGLREQRLTTRDHFGWHHHLVADRPSSPAGGDSIGETSAVDYNDHFPYLVRLGDTVETMARDFSVSVERILEINPVLQTNPDGTLKHGVFIKIPPSL